MQKDKASLADILDSMRLTVGYVGSMTVEEFERSIEKVDSVSRRLEIIGEATKRLSMSLREAHPGVPWRTMSLDALSPSSNERASISMDFPAPVSPVSRFSPAAKSTVS